MPNINFPFEVTELVQKDECDLTQCGIYRQLSSTGKEYAEENKQVMRYLHMIPIEKIGIPEFYSSLTKKLRSLKKIN